MVTRKKKARAKKTVKKSGSTPETGETITLDPVLVIDDAAQLHKKLVSLVEKKTEINIDAAAVNMIDTAMLQLLTSFVVTLKKENIKFNWKNPSEEFVNRAISLNLEKVLELG